MAGESPRCKPRHCRRPWLWGCSRARPAGRAPHLGDGVVDVDEERVARSDAAAQLHLGLEGGARTPEGLLAVMVRGWGDASYTTPGGRPPVGQAQNN